MSISDTELGKIMSSGEILFRSTLGDIDFNAVERKDEHKWMTGFYAACLNGNFLMGGGGVIIPQKYQKNFKRAP